jgi:hypothetical protein
MEIKKILLFDLFILPFGYFILRKWYIEYKIDFHRDEGLKFQSFFGWMMYNSWVTPFESFSFNIKKMNENPKLNPAASFQIRENDSEEIKLLIQKHDNNKYYLLLSFLFGFFGNIWTM